MADRYVDDLEIGERFVSRGVTVAEAQTAETLFELPGGDRAAIDSRISAHYMCRLDFAPGW